MTRDRSCSHDHGWGVPAGTGTEHTRRACHVSRDVRSGAAQQRACEALAGAFTLWREFCREAAGHEVGMWVRLPTPVGLQLASLHQVRVDGICSSTASSSFEEMYPIRCSSPSPYSRGIPNGIAV